MTNTIYSYLGVILSTDKKIQKTTKIYNALNKSVFGRKCIDQEVKVRLYNAIGVSSLVYANKDIRIYRNDNNENKQKNI